VKIRPIDIAKKLNISTSTLRHYESWGIVPLPERKPNGYRIYTEVHEAYFQCIRAMFPGFGVPVTSKIMKSLQNNDVNAALWIANEAQASLHRDKTIAVKTIQILESQEFDLLDASGKMKWMTIGQVSK
jgi:DNA-binding transcriptional MerR regulator